MLKFNNKVLNINGNWLNAGISPVPPTPDPYNPLNLPPNTVRVRTILTGEPGSSYVPKNGSYDTATLVTGTTDVYDVYKSGTDFTNLFRNSNNVVEVLGANTTGITNMTNMFYACSALTSVAIFNTSSVTTMLGMFYGCRALTTVPLFDTSNVTSMENAFYECRALTSVPLFDTSSLTNMKYMFYYCDSLTTVPLFDTSNVTTMQYTFLQCKALTYIPLFDTSKVTNMQSTFNECQYVQHGALALYQQASSQANPPSNHGSTFRNCGIATTTGSDEILQIPSDWGGLGN